MVIGQKKYTGSNNNLEKRVIEISGEKSMVRSFENGLKNFQEKKDYSLSDNGLGEKTYTIYLPKLKRAICENLKSFIRITGFEDEEFIVKIKKDSEREFDFDNNFNFNEKDKEKNKITYPTYKEFISDTSQTKDLTAEEEQRFKDEDINFFDSSHQSELEKRKKEKEKLEESDIKKKGSDLKNTQQEVHGKWTKIDGHWYFLPSLISFILLLLSI
ncbi:MAG: hypothetical protein I3273_06685 [Candidatus Moeniiplasma glomeromycotorum]|nr:hypothetical protein [Candidatus Moeniiplasma glomeromycotorum]MCE8169771.1 hypothetical protein [Candidatus Moeniiplasma glomeromycotorum]